MTPGILALLLLVVGATLSSMAIVREKELGTLEQLNITPLARWELIVGKLVPYALLGMVDVFLVVAVAVGWFEVPGFIFPIENIPALIQSVTYLIPLRYFLVILRGIFLKGVGLDVLWPQALALLTWGVAILTLATLRSTRRLA